MLKHGRIKAHKPLCIQNKVPYRLICEVSKKIRISFWAETPGKRKRYQNSRSISFSDEAYRFFKKNSTNCKKMSESCMWKSTNYIQRTWADSTKET